MAWIDNKKANDIIPQSWIINFLKIYKIYDKNINFITEAMKNRKVELTAGRKALTEVKILRGIFQRDVFSPLLFVIATHTLRKCTGAYKFTKSLEKINHLMWKDDIKLFAKKQNKFGGSCTHIKIYSQNVGMEFGIEKCIMLIIRSKKRQIAKGIELPNKERI